MQDLEKICGYYNSITEEYSSKFLDELSQNHFDRLLLKAFQSENKSNETIVDLGCGPGHLSAFLAGLGAHVKGVDISSEMIIYANTAFPSLDFEIGDILALTYPDNYFSAGISFYSLVHFNLEQVREAFVEINRVLKPNSQFLFSFHLGEQKYRLDDFFDKKGDLDIFFFKIPDLQRILSETDFQVIDIYLRQAYSYEYQSDRGYIWVKSVK
ncbi:class I SAM-dependent methyltransferase [Algoriphagus resistens]|uniref:class I SAM-dependent methyltransferase n=1 Tax=Algoriphagus resistens TaxID=1750590 RepID=UPI000716983A|nr:class I SAM-dependent methyltransferase [Algoriphagus resistens]